jgi:hypothetical protein
MTVKELEAYLALCRLKDKTPSIKELRDFVTAERSVMKRWPIHSRHAKIVLTAI